ncbi:hypothetical protein G9A89_014936 [Geosiphon pyriformis]|nr:hypothetical protein G9A89_014936 [Geosiphon pyriformis]
MRTTSVLRGGNIHWSLLGFSKCAKYEKLGHTSLGCAVNGNISSGKHPRRLFSDLDKSRLATIYAKYSAPITHPVTFGGIFWAKIADRNVFPPLSVQKVLVNPGSSSEIKPTIHNTSDVEKRFAVLESSLANLAGQIDKLAKRLNSFMSAVFQPSPRCQLPVTLLSQNQVGDVVMRESLDKATSGKTVMTLNSSASTKVKRLKSMLEELSALVLSLTVFTSGLDSGHLDFGVVIIMNISLARHVCKVFEIPGYLFSLKLLFKNNLSVSILGLYAGTLSVVWFFQVGKINSLIAKTVNKSSFIILGGDFNEDESRKCASFKKYFDLGLVDFLRGSLFVKTPTWTNFCGVAKALNYILVSLSLVNTVTNGSVANVEKYFDTDHKAVSASVDLGGLLDVHLSSICKQANKDCWKFDVKSMDVAK